MSRDGLAEALAFLEEPGIAADAPRRRGRGRRAVCQPWLVASSFLALHAAMILAFLSYTGLAPIRGLERPGRERPAAAMPTRQAARHPLPSPGPQAGVVPGRRGSGAPPHASPAPGPRAEAADPAPPLARLLRLMPTPGFETGAGADVADGRL